MRRTVALAAIALLAFLNVLPVSAESVTITGNDIGKHGEFDYELWRDEGEATMNLLGGGNFECSWDRNETNNVLFRMGKKLGSTHTYKELGEITLDYGAKYNISSGDVSYLCLYGWTVDPLIEFYVVENYGNYKPPGGKGFKGTIELDGGTYELYEDTRVDMPSIQGTKTFKQYFSVRTDKRSEGTISLTEQFKAWEELGLDMSGAMYETALCVEGYQSSGNAKIYNHVLTIGEDTYGTPAEPPLVSEEVKEEATEDPTQAPSETDAAQVGDAEDEKAPISEEADSETDFPWVVVAIGTGAVCVVAVYLIRKKKK